LSAVLCQASRYADGKMHIMFIKGVDAEVKMLLGEGYVEVEK
jgi:hypothetical protein